MPITKIERVPDRYSAYGNNADKTDLENELQQQADKINEIIDEVNTREVNALFPNSQEGDILTLVNGELQAVRGSVLVDSVKISDINDLPKGIISAEHIIDGSISGDKIAKGVLTLEHIKAEELETLLKVPPKSIGGDAIADGSITLDKIQDGSIPAYLCDFYELKNFIKLKDVWEAQEKYTLNKNNGNTILFEAEIICDFSNIDDGIYNLIELKAYTDEQEQLDDIHLSFIVNNKKVTNITSDGGIYFSYIIRENNNRQYISITLVSSIAEVVIDSILFTRSIDDKPCIVDGFATVEVLG